VSFIRVSPDWLDVLADDLSALAVLLALARYADNHSREAHPAVITIAAHVRQSERNVTRCLARLKAVGLLVVVKPAIGTRPTIYRLVDEVPGHQESLLTETLPLTPVSPLEPARGDTTVAPTGESPRPVSPLDPTPGSPLITSLLTNSIGAEPTAPPPGFELILADTKPVDKKPRQPSLIPRDSSGDALLEFFWNLLGGQVPGQTKTGWRQRNVKVARELVAAGVTHEQLETTWREMCKRWDQPPYMLNRVQTELGRGKFIPEARKARYDPGAGMIRSDERRDYGKLFREG
jgi:hypothetical protein